MKKDGGQALIEFIISFFLLFLCSLSIIEVARLISFKNSFQAATSFVTHKIAYSQIDLIENEIIQKNTDIYNMDNSKFIDNVSNEIENYFKNNSIRLYSFDNNSTNSMSNVLALDEQNVRTRIKIVNYSSTLASGVYLESQTCLPVLFSIYFKFIGQKGNTHSIEVGNSVSNQKRTCLGYFNTNKSLPLSWFSIRVAAYSPWPASTQIYYHGIPQPVETKILEQENAMDIQQTIKKNNLTRFFYKEKNYESK